MPVKNSPGRGFCAGFWNKIRREKSPSRGEQVSSDPKHNQDEPRRFLTTTLLLTSARY
ncbi:hypothetical protein MY4824_003638 [Beauveria thailandica]